MKISISVIFFILFLGCQNSAGVNYPNLTKNYHIKITFTVLDGSNYLTLPKHVEKIKYKITKLAKDTDDVETIFTGTNHGTVLLLKEEVYREGRFSAFFSWKDKNGIELYVLNTVSDTVVRKNVDYYLDWRVGIKRRYIMHQIISDLAVSDKLEFMNIRYHNTNLDSISLDSIKSNDSRNFYLPSVLSGNYNIQIKAFFTDGNQRDTTVQNILLGLNSDTTKMHLKTFLH